VGTVVGFSEASTGAATATSLLVTRNGVTPGNALVAIGSCGTGGGVPSFTCSDDAGGAYGSQLISTVPNDPTNHQCIFAFVAPNSAGGNVTTTVGFGGSSVDFRGLALVEVSGVATSAVVGASAGQYQSAPGTATDAITSGLMTPSAAAGILIGLALDTSGAAVPTSGSGLSLVGNAWSFGGGSAQSVIVAKTLASASPVAATFTQSAAGPTVALGVVLLDPAPPAGPFGAGSGMGSARASASVVYGGSILPPKWRRGYAGGERIQFPELVRGQRIWSFAGPGDQWRLANRFFDDPSLSGNAAGAGAGAAAGSVSAGTTVSGQGRQGGLASARAGASVTAAGREGSAGTPRTSAGLTAVARAASVASARGGGSVGAPGRAAAGASGRGGAAVSCSGRASSGGAARCAASVSAVARGSGAGASRASGAVAGSGAPGRAAGAASAYARGGVAATARASGAAAARSGAGVSAAGRGSGAAAGRAAGAVAGAGSTTGRGGGIASARALASISVSPRMSGAASPKASGSVAAAARAGGADGARASAGASARGRAASFGAVRAAPTVSATGRAQSCSAARASASVSAAGVTGRAAALASAYARAGLSASGRASSLGSSRSALSTGVVPADVTFTMRPARTTTSVVAHTVPRAVQWSAAVRTTLTASWTATTTKRRT